MKMKKALAMLLTCCMGIGAMGVSGFAEAASEEPVKVAVLLRISDMYAAWMKDAFEAEAKNYPNMELTVMDTQDDSAVWMSLVENCINDEYDYIVSQGRQGDLSNSIKAAREAGIAMININYKEEWMDEYMPSIMCDDVKLGEIIAADAADKLGENANICILNGPAGVSVSTDRREGFQKGLIDVREDVTLLDEQDGGFAKDVSMKKTEDWLQLYDKVDGYVCASDSEAVGVIEAYHSTGTSLDGVLIYGIDGLTDACQAIIDGEMTGSALQDATQYSKIALEMINADVAGETDIVGGKFEPLTVFDPVLLDASNAQEQFEYYDSLGLVK